MFIETVARFNKNFRDLLFHSLYDGTNTSLFSSPFSKTVSPNRPTLIIDCPPHNLDEKEVSDWLIKVCNGKEPLVRWAKGPFGSALVAECTFPSSSSVPADFHYNGRLFLIKKFPTLPKDYVFRSSVP